MVLPPAHIAEVGRPAAKKHAEEKRHPGRPPEKKEEEKEREREKSEKNTGTPKEATPAKKPAAFSAPKT